MKISLVRGPAIITVDGECYILGVKITNQKIFWNSSKVLPIEKKENTRIQLIGNKGQINDSLSKKDLSNLGMSIWKKISDEILNQKNKTIAVIGPSDSGKSTFSLYLANRLTDNGQRPLLLDADVGQGDLAPPTCIGAAVLVQQIIDLSMIKADYVSFIGSTQPSFNETRIINCVNKLITKSRYHDRCIINTDGYVNGKGLYYKLRLLKKIKPDCIVCLGKTNIQTTLTQYTKAPNCWKFIIKHGRKPNSIIKRTQVDRYRKRMNTFAKFVDQENTEVVQIHLKDIKSIYYRNRFHKTNYSNNYLDVSKIRHFFLEFARNKRMENVFTGLGLLGERDLVQGYGIIKNFENDILFILTTCKKFDSIYLSELQLDFIS